jgi:hypothetical protein
MALWSNKKGIREAKESAGAMQYGAGYGLESVDAQNARMQAAEEAKLEVFSLLGAEGTYGPESQGVDHENLYNVDDPDSYYDTSGLGRSQPNQDLKQSMPYSSGKKGLLGTPRSGILDPKSYASKISKTSQFRTMSKQVAESEQLLNQEGPAWEELKNSSIGSVNDNSALMLRDTLRQLRNNAAKGGSARRTALNEFNIILAQERAQRVRVENTWKSNLALHDLVRKNADRVQGATHNFMQSLPEVNDAFRAAMSHSAQMQMNAGQMLANVAQNAYAVKQSQQPVNFGTRLAEGLITAVVSMVPYVGSTVAGAMKQAGASGGYGGYSSYTDPQTGATYGASGPTAQRAGSDIGALVQGIGSGGGGDGMLSTSQVAQGYNAAKGYAGTAWSSVSGTVSGWGWSDVRLKENLEHVGWQNGHNVYEFNFRGDEQKYRGALAQEVIKTNPEAVAASEEGYLLLNYEAIGVELRAI